MPPVVVGASRFASALETGEAKLWVVLLGINDYQDETLPKLRYAALDCQGLGEALTAATQAFPQKEFLIHHDLSSEKPTLHTIQTSLHHVVRSAKPQDTVLLYFSGHGILDPESQQTVLCLADTQKQTLLQTGLCFQDLLMTLAKCAAHSQLIWLDACHSGNLSLSGARGHFSEPALRNPTPQLLELLRQRAAKSRGFYAMLSCDQGQQSWEFPDLGHGVFSYYLMRGLRGEAAGSSGIIDADGLYRYIYHRTTQYIEQTNQQLRLINQQKRNKGETDLYPEYSIQTPKRIVEGVGETILGLKPSDREVWQQRQALLVDGLTQRGISPALCEVLQADGGFELTYFPQPTHNWSEFRSEIATFLQQDPGAAQSAKGTTVTRLLYLRGRIESSPEGDAWLFLGDGAWISRAVLRQELRQSRTTQQIVILDCPGAIGLEDWVEDLKLTSDRGQCILACASPSDEPELFAQVLLEVLVAAVPQTGLSMASLLAKLQTNLDGLGLGFHLWLSGTQGLIEMLPPMPELLTPSVAEPVADLDARTVAMGEGRSAEVLDRLKPLLLRLVGPIAASLVDQVSESIESKPPHQLITELSALLPAKHRSQFEREAIVLAQLEIEPLPPHAARAAIAAPSPVIPVSRIPESSAPQRDTPRLTPEALAAIEQFLMQLVGPIAPALLGQLSLAACDPKVLLEELEVHLSPSQQAQLSTYLATLQSLPPEQNSHWRSAKGYENPTEGMLNRSEEVTLPAYASAMVTASWINACEQELTELIGPIAKFIVTTKRDLENQVSPTAFVEALMTEIPDPQKAAEFRRKMLW